MAKHDIQLRKTNSVSEEIARLQNAISQRAYDLFTSHDGFLPGPLADWLRAERELVWTPAVELRQKDDELQVEASVAGIASQDLEVQVTPDEILIKGKTEHKHEAKDGTVHLCEFQSGQMFRAIRLPARIDPDSVKAEQHNGLLRVTARIAKDTPTSVRVA